MLKLIAFISCLIVSSIIGAQNTSSVGVPPMISFPPENFNNSGKIWDIASAENGMVYMATDKGLLEFDGTQWQIYKGSNGFTRSVLVLNDSIIYTGSDLDFGIWRKNNIQQFFYTSLFPFKKETQSQNEEFWHIYQQNDIVIFQSFYNIYIYKQAQLIKIPAPSKFLSSFSYQDTLYFNDEKNGLLILSESSLKQYIENKDQNLNEVMGLFKDKEITYLVTKKNGLLALNNGKIVEVNNELSNKIKNYNAFIYKQLNDKYLAFGTILNGLLITDAQGNLLHHINKNKGLINNTVLSIEITPNGKLFIGLDYGLSAIDLKSKLRYFFDFRGEFGTGNAAIMHQNHLYVGTNQGLYVTHWDNLNNKLENYNFQLIKDTEGQVWDLKVIDNKLFVGHDKGLFVLENNQFRSIENEPGCWKIVTFKDKILSGNYNGISVFQNDKNQWKRIKKLDQIFGSCNQIVIENDSTLWVFIPNYGAIKAIFDANFTIKNKEIFELQKFAGENHLLKKVNENIVIVSTTNYYQYFGSKNQFKENAQNSQQNLQPLYMPLGSSISVINNDYLFYPIFNGFALKSTSNFDLKFKTNKKLILRKIVAFNNVEQQVVSIDNKIPYSLNNVNIEIVIPNEENVNYEYSIDKKKTFQKINKDNLISLINLKSGKNRIFVRAYQNDELADETEIVIRVASPWYKTPYAIFIYILLFFALIYLLFVWQNVVLKKQKKSFLLKEQQSLREQAEKYRIELMGMEQEILKTENNQIKQQLKNKTIELANKAKDNEEKNKLLLTIKEKFEVLLEDEQTKSKYKLNEIKRLLDTYINTEDKTFEIQMDELHQEFFKKLKDKYPILSTNDLRLCAYLKIGLNSKEISNLLNIQPSSAFISRSRLRKKLNLDPNQDLIDFLNAI